ncbi:MAG: hypothetical protein K0S08_1104 [Gammaproteobacteria bacterium]|jgi:hypothetical protein|nr:hypothetical protein [Gammaproteobacteria bacterium]
MKHITKLNHLILAGLLLAGAAYADSNTSANFVIDPSHQASTINFTTVVNQVSIPLGTYSPSVTKLVDNLFKVQEPVIIDNQGKPVPCIVTAVETLPKTNMQYISTSNTAYYFSPETVNTIDFTKDFGQPK